jgi:hypothetical protein
MAEFWTMLWAVTLYGSLIAMALVTAYIAWGAFRRRRNENDR